MNVAGIDPGKNGAIVLITEYNRVYSDMAYGVPLVKIKGKDKPNYALMAQSWGDALAYADHVFIEQVGAMPGQGVTSMFNFGYVAGFMYGLVQGMKKPHTFVTPQKWKGIVGISGSDGEVSRQRASQLFPCSSEFWPRKKDDGVAEAALIAYAGHQLLKGS
jgi:crossover junction endodeoxyribonuclease RuvC